eukprot:c17872_g1_i2.p1 GENE.c17872_g1_i2~~c17872_g1_i2.p1  ORF type:complete len:477 (+),score=84.65 c17872_g1_i2:933-2363(+)
MATMQVMLTEVETPMEDAPSMTALAEANFKKSQQLAVKYYEPAIRDMTQIRCNKKGPRIVAGAVCSSKNWNRFQPIDSGGELYGNSIPDSSTGDVLDLRYMSAEMCVTEFRNVFVSGPDAVILSTTNDCSVFVPHHYLNLALNIPMFSLWAGEQSLYDPSQGQNGPPKFPPLTVSKAILTFSYAGVSFYHFITETLPRIIFSVQLLAKDPALRLVVPAQLLDASHFTAQLTTLVAPNLPSARLIGYQTSGWGVPRLHVREVLYHVTWDLPGLPTPEHTSPRHALPPPRALQTVRDALTAAVPPLLIPGRFALLVACVRAGSSMRNLENQTELLEQISTEIGLPIVRSFEELERVHQSGGNAGMFVFDGSLPNSDAIRLFARADAVVGVHGGALANAVVCREGALLLELAFRSPYVRHYAHLAQALNLRYSPVWLEASTKGVGSDVVRLQVGGDTVVVQKLGEVVQRIRGRTVKQEL